MAGSQPPLPIRVLLVDDQRAVLAGLAALVQSEAPRMQVVGQARRADEARALAQTARPHVVVLDADLAGEDGLALIPALRAACAAVLVCTCLTDPELRRRAEHLGAAGFVRKGAPGEELLAAIVDAAR